MGRLQRAIYRELLDICYDTEKPLPLDRDELYDAIGAESEEEQRIVERLLRFKFEQRDDGFHHAICEKVIGEYHAKADVARENGRLGGRPKGSNKNPGKPSGLILVTQREPDCIPAQTGSKANQEPITKNQKESRARGSALPDEWRPTPEDTTFCKTERPDLRPSEVATRFYDYWIAVPGAKGRKLDWSATWRNWVRNEDAGKDGPIAKKEKDWI